MTIIIISMDSIQWSKEVLGNNFKFLKIITHNRNKLILQSYRERTKYFCQWTVGLPETNQ